MYQPLACFCVFGSRCNSETQRNWQHLAIAADPEGIRADFVEQTIAHLQGRLFVTMHEQHHELIAGVAYGQPLITSHLAQKVRYPDQRRIPDLMPVCVVDTFKIVNVHHNQRKGIFGKLVPGHFGLEILKEKSPVVNTGEFILKDQTCGIFSCKFK